MVEGSNELGLHLDERLEMPVTELEARCREVEQRYYDAGAHFVIRTMKELPDLIKKINALLAEGKTPSDF